MTTLGQARRFGGSGPRPRGRRGRRRDSRQEVSVSGPRTHPCPRNRDVLSVGERRVSGEGAAAAPLRVASTGSGNPREEIALTRRRRSRGFPPRSASPPVSLRRSGAPPGHLRTVVSDAPLNRPADKRPRFRRHGRALRADPRRFVGVGEEGVGGGGGCGPATRGLHRLREPARGDRAHEKTSVARFPSALREPSGLAPPLRAAPGHLRRAKRLVRVSGRVVREAISLGRRGSSPRRSPRRP